MDEVCRLSLSLSLSVSTSKNSKGRETDRQTMRERETDRQTDRRGRERTFRFSTPCVKISTPERYHAHIRPFDNFEKQIKQLL